jgi:hypothetical protein
MSELLSYTCPALEPWTRIEKLMNNQKLQYYIHDEVHALRFELAGSLSGEGAQSVCQAWQTALSIIGNRTLIIDITFVSEADERGRDLLGLWHQNGARLIAASPESQALAQPFLGEPAPTPPPKQSWFRRLTGFLLRRLPIHTLIPAESAPRRSVRRRSDRY